ncbi:MAG: hypothetical protein GF329_10235 [Candidatus Lokiarchaeota archaeon]|nr:hypothetical protein [Candidatus Lokiarchaeota archaeon]
MDKKETLISVLKSLKDVNLKNIMIIKTNGKLLANNFPDKAINYIKNIVKKYKTIPVNNYVKASVSGTLKLILYKIISNMFIICLAQEEEKKVIQKFKEIYKKFSYKLIELYEQPKKEIETKSSKIIKNIVFSKANEAGPSPIAWIPENLNEQEKFEISAKSILVLSAGFDQTSPNRMDNVSSIIPFISLNCIGLVYTFMIPSKQARGNYYDAAITVLVKESFKKLLLDHLERLEIEIKEITKEIINGKTPKYLLQILKQNLDQIMSEKPESPKTQSIDNYLKKLMMSEIKKIQDEKPYSTLLY